MRLAVLSVALMFVSSLWSSIARAQEGQRALLRQLYGDVAVEVRDISGGAMRFAFTDGDKTIALTLLARDVRRWADSATRVLAARRRARDSTARWQARVEGPGVEAGAISLSRTLTRTDTTIAIFAADAQFESVRAVVTAEEARALVGALRRAANAILNPPRGRSGRGRGQPPPQSLAHGLRLGVPWVEHQPGLDLAQR